MTRDTNSYNAQIIEEFRTNDGKVGGPFQGLPMLLLHTTGAKSGAERINPLAYQQLDDAWAVFASKGGATTNPDWYYNVRANANVTIEVGTDTIEARARIAEGAERDEIWSRQKQARPVFAEYEQTAAPREIPVIVIEPS